MTDYEKSRAALADFLATYGKCAEDPNREGLVPEDIKEGKPQTEEVNKGDGMQQGAAGKETAADIKAHVPAGTSVEGSRVNSGDSTAGPKVEGEYKVETAQAPDEDIKKMDSIDVNVKKAAAQNILLGSRLMDVIDREFELADAMASKSASDGELQLMLAIKQAAEAQKEQHVAQVMAMLGCSAKVANELLNQVAEEDPAAVMPAETMDEADADAILAQAAEEDAEGLEDYEDEEFEDEDEDFEDEEDLEDEEIDEDALAEEIQGVIDQLTAEGYDEEEVASAILEDAGITSDDIAEMISEELANQGMSPEESAALVSELESLQEEGVTPDDLANALSDEQ